MSYSPEIKEAARKLFLRRYKVPEIEHETGVPRRTLYYWAAKLGWFEVLEEEEAVSAITRRLVLLAERDNKTALELDEMDRCVGQLERLEAIARKKAARAAMEKKPATGHDSKPQEQAEEREEPRKKRRRRKRNNDFSGIDADTITEKFKEGLFGYQLKLWEQIHQEIRNVLKSRQIGLTYYFAREAFANALLTGENQVFLSASRAQADIFREYIQAFAAEWFDVELKGKDKIKIHSDAGTATLYFLSTNSATSQGYHGHVYVDEYFWIPGFDKLDKLASAMATQARYRLTYFSTPSAKSHDAYPFWSGKEYNEYQREEGQPEFRLPNNKQLSQGSLCVDGVYRQVITIHDAIDSGCNLFDMQKLRRKYRNPDVFSQLFECRFIDDTASVLKMADLEKCLTDISNWRDFKPGTDRPFGNRPVWIGYDPSRTRDGACIVVIAPPNKPSGKFRVLQRITMHNSAWQFQAAAIKELTKKYNVQYIGIDTTGPGSGVFEMVQQFYPAATPIHYSPDMKTRLVLKTQQVVLDRRVEWDASWSDIAAGFMQIRKTTTASGQISYVADRTEKTGHADAAWAVTHVLINEGLLTPDGNRKSKVVFSEAA